MFRYPYTNFHELNLDWILSRLQTGDATGLDCLIIRPEYFPDSDNPVQDAIDFAQSSNRIVLLSGTYDIATTLQPFEGCVIIGLPGAMLRSQQQNAPGFAPTTIINCVDNLLIYGVIFDGNRVTPSQSVVSGDLEPGAPFILAPLVFGYAIHNATFQHCTFTGYDSNRSTYYSTTNFAVIGLTECTNIQLHACVFSDNLREGVVMVRCTDCIIDNCEFTMGDYPGETYSEISLARCDGIHIRNTTIFKASDVTTSLINAMSDNVTIENCHFVGTGSLYGVDYGNEIAEDLVNTRLTIRNCYLNCHISGASTFPINHDYITVEGCTIDGTGIRTNSGVIMVYGSNDNRWRIANNRFVGTLAAPTLQAIRLGSIPVKVIITGNTFDVFAIRLSATLPTSLDIIDNVFETDAIYQGEPSTTAQTITIIGSTCRRVGRFGSCASDTMLSCVLIGCDFRRSVLTNAASVDASLSYIRGS